MIQERDEAVRALAFRLWEEHGTPEGRDQEYWYRAEAIIARDESLQPHPVPTPPAAKAAAKPKAPVAKAPAAKAAAPKAAAKPKAVK